MKINQGMIENAIDIAYQHKQSFENAPITCLKLHMRIGLATANRILEELENLGVIGIEYRPKYKVTLKERENK